MATGFDAEKLRRIRRRLLAWFDCNKRDLPWRRTRDPYAVWLSEMMLQQTQVATVTPYYERFLARFPTVADLASAAPGDVLQLWAGLGYYARARNLHRAARRVASDLGGRFPNTVDELRKLPGVGPYSAAAVASIAFDIRAAAIDGNVGRVVARLFNLAEDVRRGPGRAEVERHAGRLLPRRRCGDFNQAMMELGATVCLPGEAAQCLVCPLRSLCAAAAAGTVADVPARSRRPAVRRETHVVAAVERDGRWLVVRRPPRGLWGGLWELPTAVMNGASTVTAAAKLARGAAGVPCKARSRPFCDLQHQLTHRTIRFVGHVCQVGPRRRGAKGLFHNQEEPRASARAAHQTPSIERALKTASRIQSENVSAPRWVLLNELDALGMSRAMRKVIEALRGLK